MDDKLELKRKKTIEFDKDVSLFTKNKSTKVMEKEVTMTSELVTEEDQETDKEFLPMLAYEKMKD